MAEFRDNEQGLERTAERAWEAFVAAAERDWERFATWPVEEAPHISDQGHWQCLPVQTRSRWVTTDVYDHGNWTAGFSLGTGALLQATGRGPDGIAQAFRRRLPPLTSRADDLGTHDLGFLFFPSYALGAMLDLVSADELDPAFRAASMLARRFNSWGRFLQAFGPIGEDRSAGTSTIDTMMNLPLLWWAAEAFEQPQLFLVARQHALTAARVFIRANGSTFQLVRFDPLSGAAIKRGTYQGATEESCWSRGQAWAVCGFAWAFAVTGDLEFLSAAEHCSGYFTGNLPADGVPPWDFADSSPDAIRDASAGAIAALGEVILGRTHPVASARQVFREQAIVHLDRLSNACINRDPDTEGVLLRSCYSKPHGWGLDGAMPWGDFYLGLALALLIGVVDFSVVYGRRNPDSGSQPQENYELHQH